MRYKIWNKEDNLITPIGEVLTPEQVFIKYPMARLPQLNFIIIDGAISMGVFMEFTQTKEVYESKIIEMASTPDMMESEVLELKQDYANCNPQEVLDLITFMEDNPPASAPTAEERIASALEFQNLLALPDKIIVEEKI